MNKAIAKRWRTNLTNGKYKQARGKLCKTDSKGNKTYCCLGVLTDMWLRSKAGKSASEDDRNIVLGHLNYSVTLPLAVMRWAEMRTDDGAIGPEVDFNLADKNDDGCSFKQIAKIIEKKVDDL